MIRPAEFARRRRELMRMAGADAALVVAAAPRRMRSADAQWPYRQDSDFHYLTGFPEPDAVLALLPGRARGEVVLFCRERDPERERIEGPRIGPERAVARCGVDDAFPVEDIDDILPGMLALLPGRARGEVVLFCRERDPERERIEGPRIGPERAVARCGVDDAFPVEDIDDILPGMLEGRTRLYCHFGRENEFDARLLRWLRRLRAARGGGVVPREFVALGHLLHELRLYKSPAELALMRRAAAIAIDGQRAAARAARPGAAEYEVEAALLHAFRAQGAVPSYPPTVAGGANACVLHYTANRDRLGRGDLLLIDAGAETECYASDLTRTWPVGGRFSAAQRALYGVVLDAHAAALAEARAGRPFTAAHEAAVRAVVAGLCALRILHGGVRSALASKAYLAYFPHKTGHWLGLDVHDVGDYRVDGEPRLLEPGMVVTVEPGIYVPPDDTGVAAKWRGLGIRIEDDLAIRPRSTEILTDALPRAPDAIEALVGA